MQPPLSAGTRLHQRYHIVKLLGQGGFGRTYLAHDQQRSNEPCVLKELIPPTSADYTLQKSRELFQREAQVLYQLHHPQVPKLLETFEDDARLFLAQEYIDGPTYRRVIEGRVAHGKAFSEVEGIQFLWQMLPVLSYIHAQGIVHRDISPENIMLRQRDRLPVLIDFGIVKDLASQVTLINTDNQATTVGKMGYAPIEQLKTGKAYPNSDLYALAVTALVLMTGRRSQDLVDEATMTWRWHQFLPSFNPQFIQILNRMVSARPQNRYQSAIEVEQALQTLVGLIPDLEALELQPSSTRPLGHGSIVGDRKPIASHRTRSSHNTGKGAKSLRLQPMLIPLASLGIACLGMGFLWRTVPSTSNSQPTFKAQPPISGQLANEKVMPAASPEPPVLNPVEAMTPPPSPAEPVPQTTPTPEIRIETESVTFADSGGRLQAPGRVDPSFVKRYVLNARDGQKVAAKVLNGTVTLQIRDSEGKSLQKGLSSWQTSANKQNSYQVDVETLIEAEYILELSIN
jgi:serine/threonine protein kinase